VANPIEAEEVTRTLASALANSTIKAVPGLIKRIIGEKLWQEREVQTRESRIQVVGSPAPEHETRGFVGWATETITLTRFREYVESLPPRGLGADVETLRRLCVVDPEVAAMLEAELTEKPGNPNPSGHNQYTEVIVDNINNYHQERESPTGTNAAYARRRLRKDAPDIYEEVNRGALSPHAGMIKAGLRQKTRTIPDDPVQAARSLARAFDTDQLLQLIDELTRYLVGAPDGLDSL
jgi:hypothetical protein